MENKHSLKKILNKLREKFPRETKIMFFSSIILILGVLIMIFDGNQPNEQASPVSTFIKSSEEEAEPTFARKTNGVSNSIAEYEKQYKTELTQALETIIGVSDVEVMVNLNASEQTVYEKNINLQSKATEELDKQGGKRSIEDRIKEEKIVYEKKGDQESPIIIRTEKPEVRGVLVVAAGAENIKVKKMIVDAVSKVLEVPVHKVSVLPKKTKGDE